MSNRDAPAGASKSEHEIQMGVIDDGGCLVPFLGSLIICAASIGAAFWLVG